MAITAARVAWTSTTLGVLFDYYTVYRLHASGWLPIAQIEVEAVSLFDDYEGRRSVAESYRVTVTNTYGVESVLPAASNITLAAVDSVVIVSNEDPTINQTLDVELNYEVDLPERAAVTPLAGKYGQALRRSTDQQGEELKFKTSLTSTSTPGPGLWRPIVAALRRDVSYICVLDPFGYRWFAGFRVTKAQLPWATWSDVTADMIELTDTPSTVIVS